MQKKLAVSAALLLSGCSGSGLSQWPKGPYAGPWAIGVTTPYAMEARVEEAAAVDHLGHLYRPVFKGVAGNGRGNLSYGRTGWSRGWQVTGASSEMEVLGAQLPMSIYIRWQSLVEPQTYDAWIELPDSARDSMRKALNEGCPKFPAEWEKIPKKASVVVGVAPGGIAQVWVMDECRRAVLFNRAQAEVVPLGPNQGRSNGKYIPLNERYRPYVEENGIPYGSW